MWKILFTKDADRDMENLSSVESSVRRKVLEILYIIKEDPYRSPYKKLKGGFQGALSRRVNHKHRIVYQVLPKENAVKVIRVLTHYGD